MILDIYSPEGNFITGCTPKYNGVFLGVSSIDTEIQSPSPIDFGVGDYVSFRGRLFRLHSVPQPKKRSSTGSCGNAYTYQLNFYADTKQLEEVPFRDFVESDNTIHFSTQKSISTYEDASGIARRIEACLNAFLSNSVNPSNDAWSVSVLSSTDITDIASEVKNVSVDSGSTCMDVLQLIYNQWKLGWTHSYDAQTGINTISIGAPNVRTSGNTTGEMSYGKGKGLVSIKRTRSSKRDLATRVIAYGSTRNLPPRHYNGISPAIKDAQSVNIQNLMIPVSHWGETGGLKDPAKAFIEDSSAIQKYGTVPKILYYDGTDDELGEIYPSIEKMTIGEIRSAIADPTSQYYPSAAYSSSERADEIKSATASTDNGMYASENGKYIVASGTHSGISDSKSATASQSGETSINFSDILIGNVNEGGTFSFDCNLHVEMTYHNSSIYGLWLSIPVYVGQTLIETFYIQGADTRTVSGWVVNVNKELTAKSELSGNITLKPSLKVHCNPDSITAELSGSVSWGVQRTIISKTSVLRLKQIGFNIKEQAKSSEDGYATISMRSGSCAGRDFQIQKCVYDNEHDDYVLTISRVNDSSLCQYFPNTIYDISSGDRFVLTGITMPGMYISAAEQRLYSEASSELNRLKEPLYAYEAEIDAKYAVKSNEPIEEGIYMHIHDDDIFGGSEYIIISSITIDYSGSIPTYKVTLMDEKPSKFKQSVSKEIRAALNEASTRAEIIIESATTKSEYSGSTESIWDFMSSPTGEQIAPSHIVDAVKGFIKSVSKNGNAIRFASDDEVVNITPDYAERANKDADGNVITSTYLLASLFNSMFRKVTVGGTEMCECLLPFFTNHSISSLGTSDDEPGSGIDLDRVWEAMGVGTNEQINVTHLSTALSQYVTTSVYNALIAKVPGAASSSNQLADKAFVNSSIQTSTATFKGTFPSASDLPTSGVDDNDYAFVEGLDSIGNKETRRYKYNGTSWQYEYTLNTTGFTQGQMNAINSGITSSVVSEISSNTSARHSHSNKSVIDNITSALVTAWTDAKDWVVTNGANVLTHLADSVKHITSAERASWDGKARAGSSIIPEAYAPGIGEIPLLAYLPIGKPVTAEPTFATSSGGCSLYDNSAGGNVSFTVDLPSEFGIVDSGTQSRVIRIQTTGAAAPGLGGFVQGWVSRPNAVFMQWFRAKIPVGYTVNWNHNTQGTDRQSKDLTPRAGTGKWEWYGRIMMCGETGTFSSGGYVYLTGPEASAANPVTWYISYAQVFDLGFPQWGGNAICRRAESDGNGAVIASTYAKLAGDTFTGVLATNSIFKALGGEILISGATNQSYNYTIKRATSSTGWGMAVQSAKAGASPVYFDMDGKIGVGTVPSQPLDVSGNIRATGAVSCLGTASDTVPIPGARTYVERTAWSDSAWATYGAIDHTDTFSPLTSAQVGAISIGELFAVVGKSTNTSRYHIALYTCTAKTTTALTGTCVGHQVGQA